MKRIAALLIFLCVCAVAADRQRGISPLLRPLPTTNIVLEAGLSQTIPGPSAIAQFVASLQVAGGDTNGVITEWSYFDSPGVVTFSNPTGLTNLGQFQTAGRYTIRVRSSIGNYYSEDSFFVFVVDQGITNFIPTVEITSPPNGAEFTAPIDLMITADASDKDGTIKQIVFYNGTEILGTSTTAPYSLVLSNAGATNYILAASVEDNLGATNLSIAHTVLVNPAPVETTNTLPVVIITSPEDLSTWTNQITIPFVVDATDADGTIASVTFSDNGVIIFSDLEAPYIFNLTTSSGTHALTATAVDDLGGMLTTTNTITILDPQSANPPPTVNITSPTNGQIFTAPASFTISATASDLGGIVSVEFFRDGSSLAVDLVSPYSASVTGLTNVGSHTIAASATDNEGSIATTNITVIVNQAAGTPPVVTLTSPSDGTTFIQGATVTLSATATDADGVSIVGWYSLTPPGAPDPESTNLTVNSFIIADPSSPYSKPWIPAANAYRIYAIAIDNTGLYSTSSIVNISVRLPIPPSITLTSPTNGQVFNQGDTITMTATVIDPDTLSTNVQFWQYQPDVFITNDTTAPYSKPWQTVPSGNYSLVAKSLFTGGVVSSAAVSIQILPTVGGNIYVDAGPAKTAQLSVYEPYFQTERTANQAQFNLYASSTGLNGGGNKYDFQYVWKAYRDMYLATLKTNYIDQALVWCESAVVAANITDINGNKNWGGPWDSGLAASFISYELYDIQGGNGMSSVVRTILTNPDLRSVFGARATVVYNFLRDHIVDKILVVRGGLPWYQNLLHNSSSGTTDKTLLMLGLLLDLKLCSTALGNTDNATKNYPALVTEFANGIKDYNGVTPCFTPFNDGLIWQLGHTWQQWTVFDTAHAERLPDIIIDCYRAGQSFDFTFVQGLANLFTKTIWAQSLTSPQFNNFIDGSNVDFLGRGPYNNGKMYAGWSQLSEFDPQALLVSQATLSACKNGVSNPSLSYNNTFLGRTALAGHIAKGISVRVKPPYAILDGIVTGGAPTSTNWTRLSGPGTYTIVKPGNASTPVIFNTDAVGTHTFKLNVVTGGSNVSDTVTVSVAAAPAFDSWQGGGGPTGTNVFKERLIFYRVANLGTSADRDRLIGVMNRGAVAGYNGVVLEETLCMRQTSPNATCLANLAIVKSVADSLGMVIIPSSFSGGEAPKTAPVELREAFPVTNTKFTRSGSTALCVGDPAPVLLNGGFETFSVSNVPDGWAVDLPGTIAFRDTTIKHGGASSIRIQNPTSNPNGKKARIFQSVSVQPFRAYKLSGYIKTEAFTSPSTLVLNIWRGPLNHKLYSNRDLPMGSNPPGTTQDWTLFTIDFNSLNETSIWVYLIATGSATGKVWFDDFTLTEIGLYPTPQGTLVRRASTPIVVKNYSGSPTYTEGVDYTVGSQQLTFPGGTSISDGTSLKVSWYQLADTAETFSVPGTSCNNEFVLTITTNFNNIVSRLSPLKAAHIRYDEMRVVGWDPACGFVNAGQHMSNMVLKTEDVIKAVDPGIQRLVWDDMFSPTHNALPIYYMCNGSLVGSWGGLSSDVVVLNWSDPGDGSSYKFWAGLNPTYPITPRNQIMAADCASTANVNTQMNTLALIENQTPPVRNLVGFMYTTWNNDPTDGKSGDYTRLEAVATIIKNTGHWGTGPAFP